MSLLRYLRRKQWDVERAREIETYIEFETADNLARGMSPPEAAAAAHRKFGNTARIREEIYQMNSVNWLESTVQDLRYAFRSLALNPGFFLVAGLSLVLGIGANTAIFQLLDAVRLQQLPVPHPEQLARIELAKSDNCCSGNFSSRNDDLTWPQWEQIRDRQQVFSHVAAWGDHRFNLNRTGEARYAEGLWVTGDFFRTVAIEPRVGRLIGAADDRPGCGSPGVVISYPFWQTYFAGDPSVTTKQVQLEGHPLPVLGVTPAGFYGIEVGRSFDVAVPACAEPLIEAEEAHMFKRHHWWLAVIGRLKPGVTVAQAAAHVNAFSPALFESTMPPNYLAEDAKHYAGFKLTALPGGSGVSDLRHDYDKPLYLLLAIAGLVLLIACANLATLMLARASTREREIAVRLALGAGRGRLIRQLLAESILLAAAGVVGGLALAQVLSRYLVSFLTTAGNPLFLDLQPGWRVLAFTSAAGVLTCILFGLYPALRASRAAPASAMKASGRGLTADRERFGARRILVITQVSLSLVLLFGALLFVRSLRNLMTLDAGFRVDHLVIAGIDQSPLNFPPERRARFYQEALQKVRNTPGVEHAAFASIVPAGGNSWNDRIEILGQPAAKPMVPWFDRVSSGYFDTMETRLIAGRDFNERDTPGSPEVAIVNEMFRTKFLGGANPLGRQFRILTGPGDTPHLYQIVGVVRNAKYRRLRDDFVPLVYVAETQNKSPQPGVWMLVRSQAESGPLTAALKSSILSWNPGISIQFHDFGTQLRESLIRERLMATLSGFFGFLAAALATIGLYGVISYMVARRRNEIGIRIALGANRGDVLQLILREAGLLLVIGLVVGAVLSIATARAAESLLYGLKSTDLSTILLAILLLAAVALSASFLPALRASRLNPMTALREE